MRLHRSLLIFSLAFAWITLRPSHGVRLHLEAGTKAVIKLGVCPYPNFMQRCSDPQHECIDDLDCPHEALCCNNGCYRTCAVPRSENVVGYVVLGDQLPLNTPAPPTLPPQHGAIHNPKSVSVTSDNWNLLLGYLCAVADRLHSSNQFQCQIRCNEDDDCPSGGSNQGSVIKCCNNCCLDPTQFIVQQRTNNPYNMTNEMNNRAISPPNYNGGGSDNPTRSTPPMPKPGMCPPVLVQSRNRYSGVACDRRCSGDRDCYGPEKCCSNGCGYACQRPISFSSGYGESLASPISGSNGESQPNPPEQNRPPQSSALIQQQSRTTTPRSLGSINQHLPPTPRPSTSISKPISVLLGVQPNGPTPGPPNSQRCQMSPTSYTECIGISPWRTRYYYHKGLNQCLPIYRCIRSGNNFQDFPCETFFFNFFPDFIIRFSP